MSLETFTVIIHDIKKRMGGVTTARQKFYEALNSPVTEPTKDAVELWNQVECMLNEWEEPICSYLKVMGDSYWETTESTVVKIDRKKAEIGFYKSTVPPFLDAISRPWVWYVEGPWEPYYIGQVRPIFGVCMNMFAQPKEKSVTYYLTVEDRSGKSAKYTTLEELEKGLMKAFNHGPHLPGQNC